MHLGFTPLTRWSAEFIEYIFESVLNRIYI